MSLLKLQAYFLTFFVNNCNSTEGVLFLEFTMRCLKKDFVKGAVFHFYNRAVDGGLLFREKSDYNTFLIKLNLFIVKYPADIFAYCLMPNHFHFLLKQVDDDPVYRLFNYFLSSYVQTMNRKYCRKGRFFESPLQHIEVFDPDYLIYLCQYIHYNPVKAGLVKNAESWEYSNYPEWINKRSGTLFTPALRDAYFGNADKYARSLEDHEMYLEEMKELKLIWD